jgi:hypothetical protein
MSSLLVFNTGNTGSHVGIFDPGLEFLKILWGLGTEEE